MSNIKQVIIILADGARFDVLNQLLSDGFLPNINRHLAKNGFFNKAVTSFPSTTGPAYLPFLTGCLPSTCNVPGIRWLDKDKYATGKFSLYNFRSYVGLESFLIGKDINKNIKTIFELVPKSYSIFNPITRGTKLFGNKTKYSRIWYWYYAHLTDHWAFADKAALKKTLKQIENDFRFIFTVFPGIDEYSHLTDPHHDSVIHQYKYLDYAIGEIVNKLQKNNKWDNTLLWIVSDHGLTKTDNHFCVNTFLEKHNLPAFFYPLIYDKKGKKTANMVSGNSMTHVYFKNKDTWQGITTKQMIDSQFPGLINDLRAEPAIDIIAIRDENNSLYVISKKGEAKIKLDQGKIYYTVITKDPFEYQKIDPVIPINRALELTIDSLYPDALYQLAHLLTSKRSGDMILSAIPGFDLRIKYETPEHKGSHGSIYKDHMLVPVLCNTSFEKRAMRTIDIFPTILNYLNIPIPENIDGTSLIKS